MGQLRRISKPQCALRCQVDRWQKTPKNHLCKVSSVFVLSDILYVRMARVGPVSSLHDRACELYYALVGGNGEYK